MGGMYAYSYQTIIPLPMLRAKFLAIFFFSFPKGILKILIRFHYDFLLNFNGMVKLKYGYTKLIFF
jgi:hypothetical protein